MCVSPVAKCPPARVAIQPPSVESSNDCGKWRSVSPCGASCSSSSGPSAPAWMRAARETASTSSTRSSAPRSSATAPAKRSRHARLDAADDARAAAVRDHRRAGARGPLEHALDLRLLAREERRRRARGRTARGSRARRRGRPCRTRGARASAWSVVQIAASAPGGGAAAAPAARRVERHRLLELASSRSRGAREPAAPPRAPRRRAARPRSPSPSGCVRAHAPVMRATSTAAPGCRQRPAGL